MKILLHGLNFSPEQIGIGKYSGEMIRELTRSQHTAVVVTTPPYYPHWKISDGYRGYAYQTEIIESGFAKVIRCPLWVPRRVTGLKRILHLASFGLSSVPVVLWNAIRFRPDVILTVEPAAFCMPTTLLAARLCGAKAWLHVQDFEIDAAFELGIVKQPLIKRVVLAVEAFLMRRFDRVSSISPNMLMKLFQKGVSEDRIVAFPNWVDCDEMKPLTDADLQRLAGGSSIESDSELRDQLRERFGIPGSKCVAMYAGNIGAKQGLETIIDVARQNASNSDLHFVICGHGAAFDSLYDSASDLDNVQFLPVQPFERFNELLNCADIHLLPQRGDAADLVMPSKLTGMLATGRPVVASAAYGTQIADVVRGRGIVVPPADAKAFGEAICRLVENSALRSEMGTAARTYAVKHLSRDSILAQFMHDLSSLCHPFLGLPKSDEHSSQEPPLDPAQPRGPALPAEASSEVLNPQPTVGN